MESRRRHDKRRFPSAGPHPLPEDKPLVITGNAGTLRAFKTVYAVQRKKKTPTTPRR
jgi:hypothetical protein